MTVESAGVVTTVIGQAENFTMQITDQIQKWLEERGIETEVAIKCGVYTEKQPENGGNVIVFPYSMKAGDLSEGAKFRGPQKKFWQTKGGCKKFWNDHVLDDQLIEQGTPLVITEGEMDALAALSSGLNMVVSVPNGAPPQESGEIDQKTDNEFGYIWANWKRLVPAKKIVLAVDNDEPGQRLANELKRRLGVARCYIPTYPEGCKDLNDVLKNHGTGAVVDCIERAKPYPVETLSRMSDWPQMPDFKPMTTGWPQLDRHFMPFPGGFTVVTGVPGHGKSSVILALLANLTRLHGITVGVLSLEMPVKPMLERFLRQNFLKREYHWFEGQNAHPQIAECDKWIDDHFIFLGRPPGDGDEYSLDDLIETATIAVVRHGMSHLLIDPWNELDHLRHKDETETEYIGRAIRQLKAFANDFDCAVTVVAHPVKMGSAREKLTKPTLYDISGSANWANKADHGIVVWRPDIEETNVEVDVKKSRFHVCGTPGVTNFSFDRNTSSLQIVDEV